MKLCTSVGAGLGTDHSMATVKVAELLQGFGILLVFLRGPPESSLDSDRPSAIHHHAVYSYKTNERLTL